VSAMGCYLWGYDPTCHAPFRNSEMIFVFVTIVAGGNFFIANLLW